MRIRHQLDRRRRRSTAPTRSCRHSAIAVMIERGAPRPYSAKVIQRGRWRSARRCRRASRSTPTASWPCRRCRMPTIMWRPDDEREVARKARARSWRFRRPTAKPPSVPRRAPSKSPSRRATRSNGIRVGMMMRKRFDGHNRGHAVCLSTRRLPQFLDAELLHPDRCRLPAPTAKSSRSSPWSPAAGLPQAEMPRYPSQGAHKYCLEMPGGWFANNGIRKGDEITLN